MKKSLLPLLLLLLCLLSACGGRNAASTATSADLIVRPASPGDLIPEESGVVYCLLAPGNGSNAQGAEALAKWLLSDYGRELAVLYNERQPEANRLLPYGDAPLYSGEIDYAPEDQTILLGAAEAVVQTGLLDYALPVFEATIGYTVEVTALSDGEALALTGSSGYDLLLLSRESWEALSVDLAPRSFDGLEGGLFPCLVTP